MEGHYLSSKAGYKSLIEGDYLSSKAGYKSLMERHYLSSKAGYKSLNMSSILANLVRVLYAFLQCLIICRVSSKFLLALHP
jgi:hypothetical protein